jgi:hypothetical protein
MPHRCASIVADARSSAKSARRADCDMEVGNWDLGVTIETCSSLPDEGLRLQKKSRRLTIRTIESACTSVT